MNYHWPYPASGPCQSCGRCPCCGQPKPYYGQPVLFPGQPFYNPLPLTFGINGGAVGGALNIGTEVSPTNA